MASRLRRDCGEVIDCSVTVSRHPSSLFAAVLALVTASVVAVAQAPDRVAERQLATIISRSPQAWSNRLCVKLREGSGAELRDGRLRSRVGVDLAAPAALFATAAAEPLFTALSRDELDVWHRRACANLPPHNRPGHLGLWFRLVTPTTEQADWLFERLWDDPMVEHVVKEPRGAPAGMTAAIGPPLPTDIPPPTPLFTSLQMTFEPAPLGHSVWAAQGILGARGQGIGVEMVEMQWHLDHEDVSQCVAANFVGSIPAPAGQAPHGTAGTSIVSADRNEYGLTGIADESAMRFYSETTNGGIPNTLLMAANNAQQGDVLMLVMMYLLGQIGATDWVPFELLQPVFDATLTITGNGRLVVVASGNGDNSLDDPRFVRRFDRTFRDSGAIFVSASAGSALSKATYANYGSRVDAHSWGEDVCICGVPGLFYPNNDIRQAYSANGTGTSSATPGVAGLVIEDRDGSPGVAGVVTALQGAALQQIDRRLSNTEVLQLLHSHGPISPDSIGRRPDLQAMLQALGAADGLALSHPDVAIGGSESVLLDGPPGAAGFLFASFATGSLDLGFNRKIHLSQLGLLTIGFLPMPTGSASFQIDVPNDISLRGLSLYLQAGILQAAAPVHVTNSGQLTFY